MDPCAGRNGSGMIRTPRVRAPTLTATKAAVLISVLTAEAPLDQHNLRHLRQGRLHAARLVATPMLPARRTAGHRAVDR